MEVLRTPDSCFENIKDYPFEPVYTNIETKDGTILRIHHIDEGPKDGPVLLAMHGQPVWSYLYSKMIPFLTNAGIRVIAPDLPGYGKSDKPAEREDYSYQKQVDWMTDWLIANDFKNLTFFGQDWGGLIGLRMVANEPSRFDKVSMGGLIFTSSYIIYFKFINTSLNFSENWLLGISPEGIGFVGMLINFTIAFSVSSITSNPPREINEMVENIRKP